MLGAEGEILLKMLFGILVLIAIVIIVYICLSSLRSQKSNLLKKYGDDAMSNKSSVPLYLLIGILLVLILLLILMIIN